MHGAAKRTIHRLSRLAAIASSYSLNCLFPTQTCHGRSRPIADISGLTHHSPVQRRVSPPLIFLALLASGCSEKPSPPLPPLLQNASPGGGTENLCKGTGPGSSPQTAAQSPEIVDRLRTAFPAGSPAVRLRTELARQGFHIDAPCSSDASIHSAAFRQVGGLGSAFGLIVWKEDGEGRLVWTSGNIQYRDL